MGNSRVEIMGTNFPCEHRSQMLIIEKEKIQSQDGVVLWEMDLDLENPGSNPRLAT